jgi:fructose-1,6-bisphosphatase/inositol monophosphatase family enzyme
MTKKLEEEFNLPPMDDVPEHSESPADFDENLSEDNSDLTTIEEALTISEKINGALAEVRGMESHDSEMDEIASQAVDSYEQLMSLGMNMTDMAAGQVFNNAANMLKIALEAKDSKVTRKLKQIDLMMKKARLDQQAEKNNPDSAQEVQATTMDRNELLKMISESKEK